MSILPTPNATTLESFKQGLIDGAWVPEPWYSRLVNEAGGTVLVDEATLWPEGQFVTTHLIAATEFLEDNPKTVQKLLRGQPAGDRLRQRQSHRGREPGGHGHLQRHGPAGRQGDDHQLGSTSPSPPTPSPRPWPSRPRTPRKWGCWSPCASRASTPSRRSTRSWRPRAGRRSRRA